MHRKNAMLAVLYAAKTVTKNNKNKNNNYYYYYYYWKYPVMGTNFLF